MNKRGAVFLDRDGTILIEKHYLHDPAAVELLPEAAAGLRRMQHMGWRLIVVTNQSGVGRGYFTDGAVAAVHARMLDLLGAEGVRIEGIYYCPHAPEAECDCRKPLPGLVRRAAAARGIDPTDSFVVGDKPCDIEMGRAVGAQTILVGAGCGRQSRRGARPDWFADTLLDAATVVEHRQRLRAIAA